MRYSKPGKNPLGNLKFTREFSTALVASLLIGGLGCASTNSEKVAENPRPKSDVTQKNSQNPSQRTTRLVLKYELGRYLLSDYDKTQINDMIDKAKFDSSSEKIEVAVWADKMLPREGASLSDQERKLADDRGEEIKKYLSARHNISSLKIFNMAEESNWVARSFNTEDAELKSVFSKEEMAPISRNGFDFIRENGASSRAVLVIVQK
jgi:hypothetical protein